MTLRKFVALYVGAVLCVGTAGATGYQILMHRHAQLAARTAPDAPARTASDASAPTETAQAMASAPPVSQDMSPPETQSASGAAGSHHHLAAARAIPSLRPHLSALEPEARRDRQLVRRTAVPATHLTHRPTTLAAATPRWQSSHATLPALRPPPVTYYGYPAYETYPPGYAYYYPSYPYYRAY